MDIYKRLVSTIVFPLHERLKGHSTVRVRRELEKSQWWDPELLEAYRVKRLREFFSDIGANVPYYRELFGRINFEPKDLTSTLELQKLPLIDKQVIRENMEIFKTDLPNKLAKFNTGGSSGDPLVFYLGNERVTHDVAAKWRAIRWWNVDLGDPEIVLWGSPIELNAQDTFRELRDRLLRTQLISAFEMSDEKIRSFIKILHDRRPKMIFGYPSSWAYLAEYAQAHSEKLDDLGVTVAFVTAERLYEHQRTIIETIFGCRVANGYGGRDTGFIAHECQMGSMHVTAEDIVVEIVNETGEVVPHGESGEIVITHTATGDFPFVRYRTGDVATLSDASCSCGRSLPIIQNIQGRTTDFVITKNRTVMHGLALIYVIRDLPQVKKFKIIQETLDSVRVILAVSEDFSKGHEQHIVQGFCERLGGEVKVQFEYVEEVSAEVSGKFRYVVSKVASELVDGRRFTR